MVARDAIVRQRDELAAPDSLIVGPRHAARGAVALESPAHARRFPLSLSRQNVALLATLGPGLVVMLADTDAGSVITAAQSGAQWGYRMVLPEVVLIPVLYVVQEMTARLGMVTGTGHAALIRQRFGRGWALLSAFTLLATVTGALISEYAGVAGVGELFGISPWATVPVVTAVMAGLVCTGSYRHVERVGIAIGLAELAFICAMLMSRHSGDAFAQSVSLPFGNAAYMRLLAANVGAVIMPWMIFYQQGAVIDRGLQSTSIRRERADTAAGAVVTQVVMISIVIALAATAGQRHHETVFNTVGQISAALQPIFGTVAAKTLFATGMLGAALVATLVSSLAGAWGLAETFGWRHSLNQRPGRKTAGFYLTFVLVNAAGATVVLASNHLISLAIDVEVMNALLLPIVLGFLLVLESTALPPGHRMRGWYRYATWALCLAVIGFALYLIPATLHL
jgi:Mn2+/Fe2+ NRAMP family transporter